jgi:hypothetical protein
MAVRHDRSRILLAVTGRRKPSGKNDNAVLRLTSEDGAPCFHAFGMSLCKGKTT